MLSLKMPFVMFRKMGTSTIKFYFFVRVLCFDILLCISGSLQLPFVRNFKLVFNLREFVNRVLSHNAHAN